MNGLTFFSLLRTCVLLVLGSIPSACVAGSSETTHREIEVLLHDASRDRDVPIVIYEPESSRPASRVVFISGGYGGETTAYSFIARDFTARGDLVVSIQHNLPGDAPIATEGDLRTLRMPVWRRGEATIHFVKHELASRYPQFDWTRLILIGHSNGGDISTITATDDPALVSHLITLDHRRVPLPRSMATRVLSIRASEYEADPGVLPDAREAEEFGMTIVRFENTSHIALSNVGDEALRKCVLDVIHEFLDRDAQATVALPR